MSVHPLSLQSLRVPVALCLLLTASHLHAALPDEIQVYDDGINAPGEFGLELHLNSTPSADSRPSYPGEITTVHGVRQTLEPSYALSEQVEIGAYLPFEYTSVGQERFAGPRLRLKYIARHSAAEQPWFYGLNFELSHVKYVFENTQDRLEIRPILGWRAGPWLVALNPVVGLPLKPGERTGGPDFSPAFKLSHAISDGVAAGVEYYANLGRFSQFDRYSQQSHTLFAALDVDRKPVAFNVAVGRGLTAAADRWTIKAIIDLPI